MSSIRKHPLNNLNFVTVRFVKNKENIFTDVLEWKMPFGLTEASPSRTRRAMTKLTLARAATGRSMEVRTATAIPPPNTCFPPYRPANHPPGNWGKLDGQQRFTSGDTDCFRCITGSNENWCQNNDTTQIYRCIYICFYNNQWRIQGWGGRGDHPPCS